MGITGRTVSQALKQSQLVALLALKQQLKAQS